MGCCNQKRQTLQNTETQTTTTISQPQLAKSSSKPEHSASTDKARLRYLLESPVVVRGLASGRRYFFSGDRSLNIVDTIDVEGLLKLGMFRMA